MTTTYELYTNENGTPKAVEGKAPAIIERVEALEADVETLEETLDNGVVTSVNGNKGDIKPEQTGCLPLRGGTLNGPLKFSTDYISRTTKNNNLNISGGNSWRDGGYFEAYGPQNNDGMVMLVANNGTTSKHLKVTISGLTYDGNNVITSAGGKITGTLYQDGSVRKSTNNSSYVVMGGSDWGYGAYLQLNGSEASGASDFCLASRLNGKHIELRGKNDGTLTWNGKSVVCVESRRSGNKWYRKYADGFIEQGGYFSGATNGNHTVTLNTAFTTTDYTVLVLNKGQISHDAFNGFGENGKTTTTMTIYSWTGATTGFYWEAKGY